MDRRFRRPLPLICSLIIAITVIVGLGIPSFYDWTGVDQSRPSPWVTVGAITVLVLGIITWTALPWLPIAATPWQSGASKGQFKIRSLMLLTAAIALCIVLLKSVPPLAVSGCLFVISISAFLRYWYQVAHGRWLAASLLACMYLPFLWVFGNDNIVGDPGKVISFLCAIPSLFPSLLVKAILDQPGPDAIWVPMLLTSLELLLATWIFRLGPKRAIAYLVLVLVTSTYGSFVLNAMVRI